MFVSLWRSMCESSDISHGQLLSMFAPLSGLIRTLTLILSDLIVAAYLAFACSTAPLAVASFFAASKVLPLAVASAFSAATSFESAALALVVAALSANHAPRSLAPHGGEKGLLLARTAGWPIELVEQCEARRLARRHPRSL